MAVTPLDPAARIRQVEVAAPNEDGLVVRTVLVEKAVGFKPVRLPPFVTTDEPATIASEASLNIVIADINDEVAP